jgi:nucleotidyltransferase/DNA polymerase involved in DNA repair
MEAKKKPGRKAINLDHNEIERLAGMGLNERQICASLGINPSTLTRKKHIKSIKNALEKGRAKAIAQVSSKLFDNAIEGKETSIIWFLKNRDPDNWKDRNILETNHTINLSHVINSAKERIPNATHKIKRLDDSIDKGKGIFLDNKGAQKNNDSDTILSPSKDSES